MYVGTKRTLAAAVALAAGIVWAAGCQEGATPGDKNTAVQQTNSTPAPAATTPAETPAVANNTPPVNTVQTPPPAVQTAQPAQPAQPAETHRTATRATNRTTPQTETHAEATPRRVPQDVTVAAGTVIDTQLQTPVATNTNKVGD